MSRWKLRFRIIRELVLVLALAVSIIFSSITVIRADNAAKDERERSRAEAVERMRRGFENFEESIDISDLSIYPDELGRLFSDATKDTPYLFYVSNNLSYSYRTSGSVVSVNPKYTMDRTDAEAAIEFCKSEVAKMAELLSDKEGELERLVGAHDLICKRFTYDITLESNNICSFLTARRGTCQGYTWTYMALLRELGIECHYVASDSIAHIWLVVKIDGGWYYSDVTWDDPPSAEEGGKYSRKHILFSDNKADADGYIDRYSAIAVKCDSEIYDGDDILNDIPFCSLLGDINHDGEISLSDLIYLRLYIRDKNVKMQNFCLACADADGNFYVDGNDTEFLRRALLNNG